MGSLVAGSTPMKTLCLFLTVLATVHCDTVTRFQLLKTEGVIHAYDEQGVVVDGFKTKITVVKDETKDSIHNATKINDKIIDLCGIVDGILSFILNNSDFGLEPIYYDSLLIISMDNTFGLQQLKPCNSVTVDSGKDREKEAKSLHWCRSSD